MGAGANIAQAVISGATQIGGALIGPIMQKRENQRQRDYETEMYERSKNDNLDFWHMSNMYNTPEQQMQRLKSAGLNPNLAYGNGSVANTADTIKSPAPNTSNSTNVQPVDLSGVSNAINQLYDLRLKDAQTNNVIAATETQKTNQQLNAVNEQLKRLEIVKQKAQNKVELASINAKIKNYELINDNLIQDLASKSVTQRKTETDRQVSIDQNNREKQKQPYNIEALKAGIKNTNVGTDEKLQNIISSKTQVSKTQMETQKLEIDKLLSELDAVMKSQGISPNSSGVSKIIDRIASGLSNPKDFGETIQRIKSAIKTLKK